jgi:argininosuccinate synthase
MKSRGVYETPGGAILHFAHRQMESLTMDREVMHLRDSLVPKYSELVYNGFWFARAGHCSACERIAKERHGNGSR